MQNQKNSLVIPFSMAHSFSEENDGKFKKSQTKAQLAASTCSLAMSVSANPAGSEATLN
jgi:hypothetical protein